MVVRLLIVVLMIAGVAGTVYGVVRTDWGITGTVALLAILMLIALNMLAALCGSHVGTITRALVFVTSAAIGFVAVDMTVWLEGGVAAVGSVVSVIILLAFLAFALLLPEHMPENRSKV